MNPSRENILVVKRSLLDALGAFQGLNFEPERYLGALLNDDSTEVGRVHLGVVHVFNLDEPKVEKREAMITNLEFLSRQELLKRRDTLETWSQLCVAQLDKLLVQET